MTREQLLALAAGSGHEVLDLSLGVPPDEPPPLDHGPATRGYPPSAGTAELRAAAAGYLHRRFRVRPEALAACAGAKEFIAGLPSHLRLIRRDPQRDVVLIPGLCYPTYEAGARLAGLTAYRMPLDVDLRMRPDLLPPEVAARALLLWVTSPGNPTGVTEDLAALARWGRERGVVVASDEAYAETTWAKEPDTILRYATSGVLAVHSLAKRDNVPGLRVGCYAGDAGLVAELITVRRDAGLMPAAPAQHAAARRFADDSHARAQRVRNRDRVVGLVTVLRAAGVACAEPDGGLFVWAAAPGGDGAAFARRLAGEAGILVRPGLEYGPAGAAHVRIAATADPAAVSLRLATTKEYA